MIIHVDYLLVCLKIKSQAVKLKGYSQDNPFLFVVFLTLWYNINTSNDLNLLFAFMKKNLFQIKSLFGLLVLLFLAIATPTVIFATIIISPQKYTAFTASTTSGSVASSSKVNGYDVSNAPFNVYNLSSKTYLVPNKSATEFTAFYSHAPNYVSVEICGDGVCGNGENIGNCPQDCFNPSDQNYCGDRICTTNFPTITALDGTVIGLGGGETTTNCPQDCGYSPTYSCGVCGYNGAGQICLNGCYGDTNNNLTNCCHVYTGSSNPWGCCSGVYDLNNCPAGSYCPGGGYSGYTGYLTAITCDAGYFCPGRSDHENLCPSGTYSATKGAASCTACPTNYNGAVTSRPGSTSLSDCVNYQQCGDWVCNHDENAINCPQDCPSRFSTVVTSTGYCGDGRCSGIENLATCPQDCHCGDGICNYGETLASCPADCACGDRACDYGETNSTCPIDCNASDGTCDPGETYTTSPTKCLCGDGICNGSSSYNGGIKIYTAETHTTCPQDCHCGDGICNYGETHTTCLQDCHCGDGICQPQYNEEIDSCPQDCYCGNQICDSGETPTSCLTDCHCGDGICNSKFGESATNCSIDCSY